MQACSAVLPLKQARCEEASCIFTSDQLPADTVSAVVQIVTAELKTEGNKDVVIYKIRVGDDTGEWTVSRRFRNFETLHRALRCFTRPSLPPPCLPRAFTYDLLPLLPGKPVSTLLKHCVKLEFEGVVPLLLCHRPVWPF